MSSKELRPAHSPAPDFSSRKIPVKHGRARKWVRLHPVAFDPIYYSTALGNRFAVNPALGWGTLYVGADVRVCLMEKYGDEVFGAKNVGHQPRLSAMDWRERRISEILIPPLKICDLTNEQTLAACGVDVGTLTSVDLEHPQEWATAIMSNNAGFDAIQYASRFTLNPCLAIYNRHPLSLRVLRTESLTYLAEAMRFLEEFEVSLV